MRYKKLITVFLSSVIFTMHSFSMASEKDFMKYAEGAARWLINMAVPEGRGYKWPQQPGSTKYHTILYYGSLGICSFFLEMYKATGNELYRKYAVGGAQWLMDVAVEENDGYKWVEDQTDTVRHYGTGLYVGVAGVGWMFADMFEALGDSVYLKYATAAGNWLISVAVFEDSTRCKWQQYQEADTPYYVDIISGTAGTGLYFLRMYRLTGDKLWLKHAQSGGSWLLSIAEKDKGCFKWPVSYYHRQPKNKYFSGFSHGTAGVGYFLAELFDASRDTAYLAHAKGATRYLMAIAVPEARTSRQPTLPQLHCGPCVSIVICPSSPAHPSAPE